MHMLDELAEIVESEFDSMKDNAIAMDKVLSALSKKCSIILDEQKSETKRMVQLLHKSRDAQVIIEQVAFYYLLFVYSQVNLYQ